MQKYVKPISKKQCFTKEGGKYQAFVVIVIIIHSYLMGGWGGEKEAMTDLNVVEEKAYCR